MSGLLEPEATEVAEVMILCQHYIQIGRGALSHVQLVTTGKRVAIETGWYPPTGSA